MTSASPWLGAGRCAVAVLAVAGLACGCSRTADGKGSLGPSLHSGAAAGASSRPATGFPARSATSSAAPATTTSAPPSSRGRLSTIVLRASDLPDGFVADQNTSSGDDATQQLLLTCLGGRNTRPDRDGYVEIAYQLGTTSVEGTVSSFTSEADVETDVALLRNPRIDECYGAAARADLKRAGQAGAGISFGSVHIAAPPAGSPSSLVAVGTVRLILTHASSRITAYIDLAYLAGPRIEADLQFTGVQAPVAKSVRQRAIAAVAARVARG